MVEALGQGTQLETDYRDLSPKEKSAARDAIREIVVEHGLSTVQRRDILDLGRELISSAVLRITSEGKARATLLRARPT
jgi:hypothetical protein